MIKAILHRIRHVIAVTLGLHIEPDLVGIHRKDAETERAYQVLFYSACIGAMFFILLLTSCHSESRISRRALKDMAKAEQRYNNRSDVDTVGAHYCNTMHPIKIGKGVTVFKTDTVVTTDTMQVAQFYNDTVYLTKTITKTIRIHDTLQRIDTFENTRTQQLQAGEIVGLRSALAKSDEDKAKMATRLQIATERANKRLWLLLLLIAAIAAYFIIKAPKLKVFEWSK